MEQIDRAPKQFVEFGFKSGIAQRGDQCVNRFGGELTRLIDGFPDEAAATVAEQFHDLVRRKGQMVKRVLSEAIVDASDDLADGALPETCLLRLHVGSGETSTAERVSSPARSESKTPAIALSSPLDADTPILDPLPLEIELSDESEKARVIGVTDLNGQIVKLIRVLKKQYDEDLQQQRSREQHRYIHPLDLANAFNLNDVEYVRRLVKRARDAVNDSLAAFLITPIETEPLIENRRGRGYRLNPGIRFVTT